MSKINVAILGATGAVGQRFIQLLEGHPFFELRAVFASSRSVGKNYQDAASWIISSYMPAKLKKMNVRDAKDLMEPSKENIDILFSALPSDEAVETEAMCAVMGYKVFSNASAFRMENDVPLMVAEINANHISLTKLQQRRGWKGFIVTNPNCTTIILSLVLKPVLDSFGIKSVSVSTLQAISGAGYPGVASLDIVDNVLPYIQKEEEKVETEPLKILDGQFAISASCQRVAVVDGHLEDVRISLKKQNVTIEEIKHALQNFDANTAGLPSAPSETIIVTDDPMRPQPKLDRMNGKGMSITVGRIRKDPVLQNGVKMTILGHNTIRGAAGQSILNAEWWVKNHEKLK